MTAPNLVVISEDNFRLILRKIDQMGTLLEKLCNEREAAATMDSGQVCELLKISPSTLRRIRPELPCVRHGRKLLFQYDAVLQYMKRHQVMT